MILAAKSRHTPSLELLAAVGADWSAADECGMTALHHACKVGSAEAICSLLHHGRLLQHGCGPAALRVRGSALTPLSIAAARGSMDAVLALLDAAADIDEVDCQQCTALLRAIDANDLPLLKLLLQKGADVSIMRRCVPTSGASMSQQMVGLTACAAGLPVVAVPSHVTRTALTGLPLSSL
jgi:ankyrin repeat protein